MGRNTLRFRVYRSRCITGPWVNDLRHIVGPSLVWKPGTPEIVLLKRVDDTCSLEQSNRERPVTTGSWKTGPLSLTSTFHAARSWTGGNGNVISGRVSRKQKWNDYRLCAQRFTSGNPNKIGVQRFNPPPTLINPGYELRVNHSWGAGGGSPPEATGYSTFGDGSISNTFPTSKFNSLWTDREELALLAKLRNKVVGHSFDMGVSLAETDKLAGTVSGTLKNLSFGVVDLLSGNYARFARRFGTSPPGLKTSRRLRTLDISGRYLEMRYAVVPALNDVFEASKAFETLSNGPRQQTFKASRRKQGPNGFYNTNYCRVNQVVTAQRTYTYEMYEELSAFRQMGLGNPLTILWERIPWSFVVDWFCPIGSYLSLIGQVPFMKGRWLVTSSMRWSSSGSYPMDPAVAGLVTSYKPSTPIPNADWSVFNLERKVMGSPPTVPRPSLRVAGAVQGVRVWNAIALAHQVFSGAATLSYDGKSGTKRPSDSSLSKLHSLAGLIGVKR